MKTTMIAVATALALSSTAAMAATIVTHVGTYNAPPIGSYNLPSVGTYNTVPTWNNTNPPAKR